MVRKFPLTTSGASLQFSLLFAKLSSFQSFISRKQLREIELQMVSAISFVWFADFGEAFTFTFTIIQRFVPTGLF